MNIKEDNNCNIDINMLN